jgi:hypothetical protein
VAADAGQGDDPTAAVGRPAPRRPRQVTLNARGARAVAVSAIGGSSATAPPDAPRPAHASGDDVIKQVRRDEPKVGRNDRAVRQRKESVRIVKIRVRGAKDECGHRTLQRQQIVCCLYL